MQVMRHRAVIEAAKDIVMASLGCSPEAALAALVSESQGRHQKLWETAQEVVTTGRLLAAPPDGTAQAGE